MHKEVKVRDGRAKGRRVDRQSGRQTHSRQAVAEAETKRGRGGRPRQKDGRTESERWKKERRERGQRGLRKGRRYESVGSFARMDNVISSRSMEVTSF